MGGGLSRNNGGNSNSGGGSSNIDDTVSASITPVGRGPNGELIYSTHDQNIMANMGSVPSDPVRDRASRRKCHNRLLAAGVAVLCVILVVLIVVIVLVVAGSNGDDDKRKTTSRGVGGDGDDQQDVTLAPTPAVTTAATTALPTTALPTTLFPTALPTALPTAAPTAIPPCPVCFDGIDVPNPNARVFPLEDSNLLTCQGLSESIQDLVRDADDPAESCLQFQVLGSIRCGCTFPHPRAYCSICPDGSLPPPEVLVLDTPVRDDTDPTRTLTCFDLVHSAATIARNREPTCSVLVPSWATFCQCPGYKSEAPTLAPSTAPIPQTIAPTTGSISQPSSSSTSPTKCTLCADGNPVAAEFHDAFAVETLAGRNLTCLQLEVELASFTDDCLILQLVGTYSCGCIQPHPQSVCDLCPSGQLPPPEFRDRLLLDVSGTSGQPLTCRNLYFQAATLDSNSTAECRLYQIQYGTRCGCFGGSLAPSVTPAPTAAVVIPAPEPAPRCSLCGDGLPVPEEFHDAFAVTSVTNGRNFTCRALELELRTFVDDCFVLQLIGSYRCGCIQPHPNAVCNLCPGGGLPPDEYIDDQIEELGSAGRPLTCEDLYLEAARIHNTTQACLFHQSRYGSQCGCPPISRPSPSSPEPTAMPVSLPPTVPPTPAPTPAPTGPCTLCADGSPIPDEYQSSFGISTVAGRNLTCLQLEVEIVSFLDDCVDLQLFGTYNCGCPVPSIEGACPLCPNNENGLPPVESRGDILDELGTLGVPLSCRDLFISGNANTNRTNPECRLFQSRYGPQCGCDFVAGDGDGSSPATPTSKTALPTIPPQALEPSSSSLAPTTTLPLPATPPSVTASPSTTSTSNCTLCADGNPPRNPSNTLLPNNPMTCLQASFLSDFLASGTNTTTPEEACFTLQTLASLECGCVYPHPAVECVLCSTLPDEETLDRILVSDEQDDGSVTNLTCGGAILAVGSIRNETECAEFTAALGPLCGC